MAKKCGCKDSIKTILGVGDGIQRLVSSNCKN